jgi:chromosomal replication initiation ATPase DnaA
MPTPNENLQLLKAAGIIRYTVCEHYDITIADVIKKEKPNQDIARAKHVICYLLLKILETPHQYAAEMVGRVNHCTAGHSRNVVEEQISVYPKFKTEVEKLESECREAIR